MSENYNKQIAEMLVRHGFAIIPIFSVKNDGTCQCNKASCTDIGKHPACFNGVNGHTKDVQKIERWLNEVKNIAIATGEPSGIWVLDQDDLEAFARLMEHGELPETWTSKTSRGNHFFFRMTEDTTNLKNSRKLFGGIDVRATGGYAILPPSKHESGRGYEWVIQPDSMDIATAPKWLIDLLPKHGEEKPSFQPESSVTEKPNFQTQSQKTSTFKIEGEFSTLERCQRYLEATPAAIEGQGGDNHTFATVCSLVEKFGHELNNEELIESLYEWNERCQPPWEFQKLLRKIDQARSKTGIEEPVSVSESVLPVSSESISEQSHDDSDSHDEFNHPTLGPAAYCGVIGDIVKAIEPETEADPAGVMLSLLTALGNVIGNGPFISIGEQRHGVNIFSCLVGSTASGKGQSCSIAKSIIEKVDPEFIKKSSGCGLASGEGLIERVSDSDNPKTPFQTAEQKRLLVVEEEFSRVIISMRREGNNLSSVLRSAWDCGPLGVMTRGRTALRASNAFVSIICHITPEEMRKHFDGSVETANGFANRFLWVLVQKTKSLPFGGKSGVIDPFIPRLQEAIEAAKTTHEVTWSDEARSLWLQVYDDLHEGHEGTYGAATQRARTQALRLALLFCLLDSSPTIEERHLKAALEVWRYCDESARFLFSSNDQLLDCNKHEKRIVDLVRSQPGIMRSALKQSISHNVKRSEFDSMINRLEDAGKIVISSAKSGNRTAETFHIGAGKPVRKERVAKVEVFTPIPESIQKNMANNIKAATLPDLLNWINQNQIKFVQDNQGVVWVTEQDTQKLTSEIEAAIRENHDVLKMFVKIPEQPTMPEEVELDADNQAFFEELRDM